MRIGSHQGSDMSSINLHAMAKQAGYHTRIVANPLRTSRGDVVLRSYSGQDIPRPSDDVPPDVSIESAGGLWKNPSLVVAEDFICSTSAFLRSALHQALEFNRAVFAREMTVTGAFALRSCE